MGFLDSLRTYGGSWVETARDKFSAAEQKLITKGVVTASEEYTNADGSPVLSVCLHLKGGTMKFLRVSNNSSLAEGDEVKAKDLEVITLERDGRELLVCDLA